MKFGFFKSSNDQIVLSIPEMAKLCFGTGADPGFFPRGGPVGHRHIATETPQASQRRRRRHRDAAGVSGEGTEGGGIWGASPKKILNMKCSRSDSEQT